MSLWSSLGVNLRLCRQEIFASRARFLISTLGLFIGVTSLLYNLAFIRGMEKDMMDKMERIGGVNILTLRNRGPETPEEKLLFRRSQGLVYEEVEGLKYHLEHVVDILPEQGLGWRPLKARGKQARGRTMAVGLNHTRVYNYEIGAGRDLERMDFDQGRFVCLLGRRIAEELFGRAEDALGETVTHGSYPLQVVGLIGPEKKRDRRSIECLVPYDTYTMRMGGFSRRIREVNVLVDDAANIPAVERNLRHHLIQAHRGVEDFEIEKSEEKISEIQTASFGLRAVLWFVAGISLVVSGISIMNIMFASLGDRIREIGVRKALGARNGDIFFQFNLEAVIVCFLGGLPGLLMGATITWFPAGVFPFQPLLRPFDYGLAVFFTMLTGLLAGLFPAMKAAGLKPVEALRY